MTSHYDSTAIRTTSGHSTVGCLADLVITKARALLITETGRLLLIRRRVPEGVYWEIPGGGVEPTDANLESAACREIAEETGGQLRIHSLVQLTESRGRWHAIFLGHVHGHDETKRSGPELSDGSGRVFDERDLTAAGLAGLELWPPATKTWLVAQLADGVDLFGLPDLRNQAVWRFAPVTAQARMGETQ